VAWRFDLGKVRFAAAPPVLLALSVDVDDDAFALQAGFQSGSAQVAAAQVFDAHQAKRRHLKLAEGYAPIASPPEVLDLLIELGARVPFGFAEKVGALLSRLPDATVSDAARKRLG
jgi:hypothetical protein